MGAEEDQSVLADLAERMGIEDDKRESFVSEGMKRLGYRIQSVFLDPEPEGNSDDNGGSFFGGSSKRPDTRQVPQRRTPNQGERKVSNGPWGY